MKNINKKQIIEIIDLFMYESDYDGLKELYNATNDKLVEILMNWYTEYNKEFLGRENNINCMYEDLFGYVWEKYNLSN